MCTVSYYRDKDKVIITSNRDENIKRLNALPPAKILLDNFSVFCPIDPQSQGTWFAVNQKGNTFVLLNGAEKKHTPKPPYKKSRGLVLLEMADSIQSFEKWLAIDLENIEPFTLVVFNNVKLMQYRWNGVEKKAIELDTDTPHIWSSSTLYQTEIVELRKEWFKEFFNKNNSKPTSKDILDFHFNTNNQDNYNGLIINRNNTMVTKNITQCVLEKNKFTILHEDLILNKQTIISDKIHEK